MSSSSPLARRSLLRAAAVAAGATAVTPALGVAEALAGPRRRRGAPVPTQRRPAPAASPRTPAPAALPPGEAFGHHLLRRATYGATPELTAELQRLGPVAWLEQQLAPQTIDDSACEEVVRRFPAYSYDPPQLYAQPQEKRRVGLQDLARVTLARACWSRRQLLEVMVEFWSNHLNTTAGEETWPSKGWEDRHVVRPHALGRFSDMLVASAASPAMLRYLDGYSSKHTHPNENYGRELLELHTVGLSAGYTAADVVATARALTGRTIWSGKDVPAAQLGEFRYRDDWHHVGRLQVLGWSHANGSAADGVAVGDSLLRYLAGHPATAKRLAHKLCVRFVADAPPPALVDRLAQVYLAHDTAIVPVLRALFASPEFAASVGQKHRRPYEDVVAAVRVLAIGPAPKGTKGLQQVLDELGQLGQAPFGWHPPNGYPDVAAAWTGTGTLLGEWNLHLDLASGRFKDGLVNPGPSLAARLLPDPRPSTRADLVTATAARLVPGVALPVAHRDALVTFLGGPGPVADADLTRIYPVLVALLLDSPAWSTR